MSNGFALPFIALDSYLEVMHICVQAVLEGFGNVNFKQG